MEKEEITLLKDRADLVMGIAVLRGDLINLLSDSSTLSSISRKGYFTGAKNELINLFNKLPERASECDFFNEFGLCDKNIKYLNNLTRRSAMKADLLRSQINLYEIILTKKGSLVDANNIWTNFCQKLEKSSNRNENVERVLISNRVYLRTLPEYIEKWYVYKEMFEQQKTPNKNAPSKNNLLENLFKKEV